VTLVPEHRTPTVAVVGGGIAGLAAAFELRRRRPDLGVVVLEGSRSIGGKLRVSEVGGLPVDEGAEAMLNRRPEAVELARAVGLGDDLEHPVTTSSAVWTRGAVRPLPPTVLGVPADGSALARSGILSPAGLARMQLDRVLPRAGLRHDVAVGPFIARRLGAEVRDRLVEPLLGGVYSGHSRELSLRSAAPQIAALAEGGRSILAAAERTVRDGTEMSAVPVFAGLRGGVGRLAQAVGIASGAAVRTDTMVRALERAASGWRLVIAPTRAVEVLDVDAVVLAVPATPAARLLSDAAPGAARRLGEIGYASVALTTFVFTRGSVGSRLTGSGFLVPPVDRRTIKAATYSSNKWGWLAAADPNLIAVRTSLGRYRDERDLQLDDVDLAATSLADLRAATGVVAAPVDTRVTRWGGALPQYTVGHAERVSAIRAAVSALPGLAVCGAAYDGVGIAACVASGREAATRVIADLSTRDRMGP
jgi:protoporphyrinogen/coproporphyrinogen III oxidase